MPKKKSVFVKPIINHNKIQLNIVNELDKDKIITPEKIFDGYKNNNNNNNKRNNRSVTKKSKK